MKGFALAKRGVMYMKRYKCKVCGYIYDPEVGDKKGKVEPGTAFEDLKSNWHCPSCGAGTNRFVAV